MTSCGMGTGLGVCSYYKCPFIVFLFLLGTGRDVYKRYWNGSVMHSWGGEAGQGEQAGFSVKWA